jgi:hypothetical protein
MMNEHQLQGALRLTDKDVEGMRYLEASWDKDNETWIPSDAPLDELIRSTINNVVLLQEHQTSKKNNWRPGTIY